MSDLIKSFERIGGHYVVTVALPGTWAVADYLGDTTNNAGLPVPGGTLVDAFLNAQTSPNASSDVSIENETTGTTHTITVDSTYETASPDLDFSDNDELSVAFTSVGATAAGADGSLVLVFEVDKAPMN